LGIYVHGSFTDRHYLEGDMTEVRELASWIRDTGVQVGLGTHVPEVIDLAEDENWDLDFYMASMYNLSVRPRESAIVGGEHQSGEHFDHDDKWRMFERIQATEKTCLAFKILGAGRLCDSPARVKEAFATAFAHIKARDAIVVGMFPRHSDQLAENSRFVREILSPSV